MHAEKRFLPLNDAVAIDIQKVANGDPPVAIVNARNPALILESFDHALVQPL
jgi:hypothetical protein